MATRLETQLDHNKLEALRFRLQNLATPPSSPALGQMYIDTDDNLIYYWDGSAWQALQAGSSLTQEQVEDIVGAMVTGNTETGIAVTYDDPGGKLDFVAEVTQAELDAVAAAAVNDGDAAGGVLSGTYPNPGFAVDMATQAELDAHLNDTTDAHDASAISFAAGGNFAATDVQAAIEEAYGDAVAYADSVASGLDWKASVRVATTANVDLATGLEDGDTIDGVTLATGDRVLVKNQTTGAENGIYVAAASGAASRAADADSSAEVTGGMAVWVNEGTANGDSGWVLTTNDAITLGTTALTFTQFTGAGQITAGAALSKTGNTLDVEVDDSTIEVSGDALRVKDAGITDAKLASTFTKKHSQTVGDGSSTSIAVTHNLGTRAVTVEVYDSSTFETVIVDVVRNSTSQVTLTFATAPASNAYTCVVIG